MEIFQAYNLCDWFGENVPPVINAYQQLHSNLQHNSTQPQKQEVVPNLENLVSLLNELPLQELASEELKKLDELDVLKYLGFQGAEFANQTVRTSDFDASTAAQTIDSAVRSISSANKGFSTLKSALEQLSFNARPEQYRTAGEAIIRVHFQSEASMSDVALWKKWSSDWHDIMRGIARCAGEKPEDVRVIGASSGSVIMILAGTVATTAILARISNHVTSIVLNVLKIRAATEDLRQKKLLTEGMETELRRQETEAKENGIESTVAAVTQALPAPPQGDVAGELRRAVERYLDFNDKGGDVDILPPEEEELEHVQADDDANDQEDMATVVAELRALGETVASIREQQNQIRLLTFESGDEEEN